VILASVLDRAGDSLGGYLPRFAGAFALLLVGLLVAALVRRGIERGLRAAGADDLGERWGVHDALERFGMGRSLSRLLARAVRLAVIVVACFAALSLVGLAFLSQTLNEGILFLPRLFVAFVLLLAGIVLGEMARRQVDRLAGQMDLPGPLGALAETLVLALFGVTALGQLGIPTEVLMLVAGILLAAAGLMFAIAFGFGGRDMAREVSARRYVEAGFDVGQEISVDGLRGRIAAIEATCTVLETGDGDRIRIPNSRLIARPVTEHAGGTH
jgi:small-conductance mechanosensitive channel